MTVDKMTDNEKRYWAYFINGKGAIEYYSKCLGCEKHCKQSYRISGLKCDQYQERKA